jgi:CTP:molybdopterin cytidylyltransferase MocA
VVAHSDFLAALNHPRVAGVLLAAGEGTRFEGAGHKLRADLRGRPLVLHALGNLTAARLPFTVVITGAVDLADVLPESVVNVPNPDWASGQATSLAAAVDWARGAEVEAIVVGLADQPGIRPEAWQAVASVMQTPMAIATYDGRRGHPVRLHRDIWDRLPRSGDEGARRVMQASPELVSEVPCPGDPTDVDTVEDLRRLR